jgi:phage baseplate assembly protein W
MQRAYLGYSITRPLQRDLQSDYITAGGVALVAAAVGQVLGTVASSLVTNGELPWRVEFGSQLELLRHRNVDATFVDIARVYVVEALQRWEPRCVVTDVDITVEYEGEARSFLHVYFDISSANAPSSVIIARDLVASIAL